MKNFDFEENIRRMDEIIAAIEGADMPLEASLALYKEGVALAAACDEALEAAEKEVLLLSKNIAKAGETRPFRMRDDEDEF
ncbi:MAG: exodeoxyribonuclease VII small subunit [Clostridiales bacterium]|jgi:exodeoxyribonuclease VII small subunit|nr:exodeoxyribonuclease VII small subunit [Clostridiales bacterium]